MRFDTHALTGHTGSPVLARPTGVGYIPGWRGSARSGIGFCGCPCEVVERTWGPGRDEAPGESSGTAPVRPESRGRRSQTVRDTSTLHKACRDTSVIFFPAVERSYAVWHTRAAQPVHTSPTAATGRLLASRARSSAPKRVGAEGIPGQALPVLQGDERCGEAEDGEHPGRDLAREADRD